MITFGLLLVIFALFGFILIFSEHEYLVISGDMIVCFCFLVYLIMFILHCVWNKNKKENKDEKEN